MTPLRVTYAVGEVSLQDLGRTGHMHEGVPPGGAAVRARLIAANRRAGNRDDAVAIEVAGELVLVSYVHVELATPEATTTLEPGQELRIKDRSWTYLAVRGGIAAWRVLDGFGALPGQRLRKGDPLAPANDARIATPPPPELVERPVRVIPGPDLDAFSPDALDVLCRERYRAGLAARTGTKLVGPTLSRVAGYRERSQPMVRGAIEVASDGTPIILGPDHPTTGGYPVLGVVAEADLDHAFAFGELRFYIA